MGSTNEVRMDAQWTFVSKEIAKLATESLVAADVGTLVDQVKFWSEVLDQVEWNMESNASNCSVSGRSKDDYSAIEMLKATTKFDGEL